MNTSDYIAPPALDQAVQLLSDHPEALVLAGGHHLLLRANQQQIAGRLLVDLRSIYSLAEIKRESDGALQIGAMTTLRAMAAEEHVPASYPVLAEAIEQVGDAQVRNRATVGGSLALADPETDLLPLLLVLEAEIALHGPQGARTIPAAEFVTGPRRTALQKGEIITAVRVPPKPQRFGLAYEKFKNPATLYAICGVAAAVTLQPDGAVATACVAATGALEYPMRLPALEKSIIHRTANDGLLANDPVPLPDQLTFRGDFFASAEYRRHLLQVLSKRAIQRAMAAASH